MKINFKDRLSRKDFVIAMIIGPFVYLLPIFVAWALLRLVMILFGIGDDNILFGFVSVVLIVLAIVLPIIFSLSTTIRRCHDLNQPWMVPVVVGFVLSILSAIDKSIGGLMSFIFFLYLAISKSVNEGNKYGKPTSYKNIWEKIGIISIKKEKIK